MTGVVKQAMPPVLMQKAGIESKGARGRAPQADFAEALGIGKQDSSKKSAAMKADGGDPVTAWPRLATKLESAFERVHHAPLKPEADGDGLDKQLGNTSGDDALFDPNGTVEMPVERDATQPSQIHVPADGAPIVLPARQDPPPPNKPQPFAAQGDKAPGIVADVEVPSSLARVTEENAPADNAAMSTDISAEAPKAVAFVPLRASERTEPQQPQFATHPQPTVSASEEGRASVADSTPDAAEPARAAPRVTVVSQQNVPAPMALTALVLVDSIAGSELLGAPNAAPTPNAIHASATRASAQSLKIQLHPAELGMVTATLRFAGEQLSIELRVENHEAYRRLTSDSETIVSSLRDLGYDIEKVTVLQPSVASSPASRPDTAAMMHGPAGRSADQSSSAMANGGNAGSGQNSPGRGGNSDQGSRKGPLDRPETSDGGLYI